MSILEILIAVAIISFVCVPVVQVMYSLHSAYILDIVRDTPDYADNLVSNSKGSNPIFDVRYHGDGNIRTIFKKGGMWGVQSVANRQAYSESQNNNANSVQKIVGGIHTRQSCADFNPSFGVESVAEGEIQSALGQATNARPTLHLYTSGDLGLSSTTKLTSAVFVGDTLFVGADSSSTTLPDIYTYSIDTISSVNTKPIFTQIKPKLTQVGSLNTGPGISQMQTRGAYLLTANTGVKSQVNVFQINSTANTTNITNTANTENTPIYSLSSTSKKIDFTIPGSNSSTTPITKTILYADGKVIVGTEKSVLSEIFIFDIQNFNIQNGIQTGQSTARVIGSIETGYGINDMLVANNMLLVAGPRDPEIEIFDMNTLQKIGSYDLAGGSGNAKVLNIFGDYLYVGRTKGGNEFEVLNIERKFDQMNSSTEASLLLPFTATLSSAFNKKIQWSIDALLKYEAYSMLFTADEYGEFQIYKEGTDSISQPELVYKVDLPDRVSSVVCYKNSIWMTYKNLENTSPYRLGLLVF